MEHAVRNDNIGARRGECDARAVDRGGHLRAACGRDLQRFKIKVRPERGERHTGAPPSNALGSTSVPFL